MLGVFLRAVASWYRRQARRMGHAGGRTGSVTVIQRASSDLRVNPHFHAIVLDGVIVDGGDGDPPVFVETPRPTDEEIKKLVETVATRVIRLLVRRGMLDENSCALDRLYVLRPPLANNRLRWIDDDPGKSPTGDDELLFTLKRKWDDGTTHVLFSPTELIGRLAAIVPRLAPSDRAPPAAVDEDTPEPTSPAALRKRMLWADLLRRVFRHDVDHCECGGRFKLIAFITDAAEARRYLKHEGLPSSGPTIAPARAPPQADGCGLRSARKPDWPGGSAARQTG